VIYFRRGHQLAPLSVNAERIGAEWMGAEKEQAQPPPSRTIASSSRAPPPPVIFPLVLAQVLVAVLLARLGERGAAWMTAGLRRSLGHATPLSQYLPGVEDRPFLQAQLSC